MFLQINLRGTHRGRPFVAMLLDNTASLQLSDAFTKSESQNLQTLTQNPLETQRYQLLQSAFTYPDQQWLKALLNSHRVELNEFSTSLRALSDLSTNSEAQFNEFNSLVGNLKFNEPNTNLSLSVSEIFSKHRGSLPDGIVIFTDGNSSFGDQGLLSDIAPRCRKANLPLFVVGLGSQRSPDDVLIKNVRYESTGFAGSEMQIDVDLEKSSTLSQEVEITLSQFPSEVVTIESMDMQKTGSFSLKTPQLKPGRNDFQIQVTELPGEADLRNNLAEIHIHARETRLKVLMIERLPRWEFHHLKKTWERDKNVQLDVFLIGSDRQFALEDKSALSQLPASLDEVLKYDVVVMGDVDLQTLNPQFVQQLPVFLREHGGGLLLITGAQFNPATYLNSSLATLIPLQRYSINTSKTRDMQMRLTLEGRENRLFSQLDGTASLEQLTLHSIPEAVVDLRSGASILLEGRSANDAPQPLILSMRAGNGQVLQHLFDQAWRWRAMDAVYETYWAHVIRFLAKQRMQLTRSPYDLSVPHKQFQVGEEVVVQLQVYSQGEILPDSVELLLQKDGQPMPSVLLKRMTGKSESYQLSLKELAPGTYISSVNLNTLQATPVTTTWNVSDIDRERTYAPMNRKDLAQAAKLSGGGFYEVWELDEMLRDLPRTSRGQQLHSEEVPIWNRWEIVCSLMVLLTTDWILKRTRSL